MTAVTCCLGVTNPEQSWLSKLEEVDYLHHGLLIESVASSFGSVFCTGGTHTFVRLSDFLHVRDAYFDWTVTQHSSHYDYWLKELGDDRWLTQLLSSGCSGENRLGFVTNVICTTMGTGAFRPLLTQRRRWLLASISSDLFANMDKTMFCSKPGLWLFRLMSQAIRLPDIFQVYLVILLGSVQNSIVTFLGIMISISFAVNWGLLAWIGFRHERHGIVLYPFLIILKPSWDFVLRIYTLATLNKGNVVWGGSRL